jgi:ABC-type sugar transport system, ATPase component
MKRERLRIENAKKGRFLKWIQLQIFEKEVVHCVFDNVQEKEMLLAILVGNEQMDFGKLYYEEFLVPTQEIKKVLKERVAVIAKESTLIDSISILENIFLMRAHVTGYRVQTKYYKKRTKALLEEFHIALNLYKPINELTFFENVQIEMLKAYLSGKQVFVLTELSNRLSDWERNQLWELIEQFKTKGIACIIAEPLEDIHFGYTDRVMIFKRGRTSVIKEVAACDYMMLHTILYQNTIRVGEEREILIPEQEMTKKFEIKNLSTQYLKNISLHVAKGEILKVFCMDEHSYEELTGVLKGDISLVNGHLRIGQKEHKLGKAFRGIKDGVGILEGSPVVDTLFKELTVMDNLQMLLSQKAAGIFAAPKYKKSIRLLLKDILPEDIYTKTVKELSEIQIQKVAYGKWLIFSPDVLVCIQPFADGDIQGRETAREMLYLLESRKIPVIIITSNTLEFNYCKGKEVYIKHGKLIEKERAYQLLNVKGLLS